MHRSIHFALLVLLLFGCSGRAQLHEGRQLVEASLVSESKTLVPGQSFTAGVRLKMQPGWHTYWKYSGDSGMPTRIDWQLPPGFKAGQIQWPLPRRVVEEGDLVTYAYPDEVLLLVEVTPPSVLSQKEVTLKAHVHWLVCEKSCIPGEAELALTLSVAPEAVPAHTELFSKYRALLPGHELPATLEWSNSPEAVTLHVSDLAHDGPVDFFPLPDSTLQIEHVKAASTGARSFEFQIPLVEKSPGPVRLSGVLVAQNADGSPRKGWLIDTASASSTTGTSSLPGWLLLGFLGGLILNVMPCVLPVIALKIFGFIKQANEAPAKILRLGLAFVAGIFAWFFLLAALVVVFRRLGTQLNWAFQFQHPVFLVVMIGILLIFALNLLGVFEILLPGGAQSALAALSGREGYSGAFLHGVFATLMATPCTAPFLGPALGFALTQHVGIVFGMFAAIAAGMSAPYLALAFQPGWLRFLPKPGMWMVRVKQALGVLLLGTVGWLGWVLYQQQTGERTPFAPLLEAALQKGRPVFVDFTADWCVNCKVNERLVLDTEPVQRAFREKEVIVLKADWTNGDPDITALLKQFGRAGVPLYVLYPPRGEPIVLPEVLTKQLVLDSLDRLAPPAGSERK